MRRWMGDNRCWADVNKYWPRVCVCILCRRGGEVVVTGERIWKWCLWILAPHTSTFTYTHTDKQTNRKTGRQMDRKINIQTKGQADRHFSDSPTRSFNTVVMMHTFLHLYILAAFIQRFSMIYLFQLYITCFNSFLGVYFQAFFVYCVSNHLVTF